MNACILRGLFFKKKCQLICENFGKVPLKSICTIVLFDFSLTVKAATLIFISGRGSAISYAKQGKSGSIYNLLKE